MHPDTRFGRDWIETPRPWGYQYAAFREIVTNNGYETGYVTGDEAASMLARAVKRGRPLTADTLGVLRIPQATRREDLSPHPRSITLEPVARPHAITRRQYEDLQLIADAGSGARLRRTSDGVISIDAGPWVRIPPPSAWILYRRGWLSQPPHTDHLTVSPAGRIAMTYHWHATNGLNWRLLKGLYLDAALTTLER